ncbi:MAG: M15 family metallopeptidase [Treponemataceae bacterium]
MKKIFLIFILLNFFACFGKERAENVLSKKDELVNLTETVSSRQIESQLKQELLLTKDSFLANFQNRLPVEIIDKTVANFDEFFDDIEKLANNDAELLILVDKEHFLPADFVPQDLLELKNNEFFSVSRKGMHATEEAVKALSKMGEEANKAGITLLVSSAYRSYELQKTLFTRYASQYGEKEASRFSARAGTSQHQLGTAFDFGSITDAFAETRAGKWLDANAERFGFSLSFPKGYETVTGYKWECWHYRYVGVEACKMQEKWFGNIQQYMLEVLHWYTGFCEN